MTRIVEQRGDRTVVVVTGPTPQRIRDAAARRKVVLMARSQRADARALFRRIKLGPA